jgi:hypothetical protein
VNEPAEAEVAHNRPAQLDDLLFGVVLQEVVEQFLVDIAVVDEEPFGVGERGLLGFREVLVTPRADAGDGVLFEGLSSP